MGCYSRLMVRHPFVLILLDIVLAFVLGPLTVWIFGLPDFSDPTKGFEPRGTSINMWERVSWNVREYKTQHDRNITEYPSLSPFTEFSITTDTPPAAVRKKRFVAPSKDQLRDCAYFALSKLNVYTPRVLVSTENGTKNIFTTAHIHSICRLSDMIADYNWPAKSCYLISLPLIITALAQKTSCYDITDSDMREVTKLVQRCAVYYFVGTLTPYCEQSNTCPLVPQECLYFNGAYLILHILTDVGFMKNGDIEQTHVGFSIIIIPFEWYNSDPNIMAKFYMETFENKKVIDGEIAIKAMSLNIEKNVFNTYVIGDVPWYVLAMSLVVIILLLYLQSMILMIAVVTNVIITLCWSYFIYYYIFQLHFFPFLNLIAALLLIAIGADDVFIIYDFWRQHLRRDPTASYEEVMSETLRKAGLSIFVTSLTTSAALFSNLASSITTIRCFGIFAGICMMVNFILMITWIPALIIITEKVFNNCVESTSCMRMRACHAKLSNASDYFWGTIVMNIITKGSPFWVVLHLAMGLLGFVVVFAKPGLRPPEDTYVKIFSPDHPFEMYNQLYKDQIRFELELKFSRTMMLQVIWGVDKSETGNVFDPDQQSVLAFIPLEIYSPEAVTWLNRFCDMLKEQPFVAEKVLDYDCYHKVIGNLVSGPCDISPSDQQWQKSLDIRPCCELSLPLNETMLEKCMKHLAFMTQGNLERIYGNEVLGQILLDKDDNTVIFRYYFPSNRAISQNYQYTRELVKELRDFVPKYIAAAPEALQHGGYASGLGFEFEFYNLQNAISYGTLVGIGISLGTGFLVLLLTSLNLIISVYAIVTISLVIACTVGTLVLLGWELNVSESLTITLSVGLAVDFTIHYGVAYKLSSGKTRSDRVKDVVQSVSSAVTMAALTTFISGIAVLPGRVLAYRQFGVFLVFVMMYSWLFSTFFFLSVCYGIGPLGNMGDILFYLRCCRKKKTKPEDAVSRDMTRGQTRGQPPSRHTEPAVSDVSQTEGSLMSVLPQGVYITGMNPGRMTSFNAHGSVDGKLMSNIRDPVRQRGANSKAGRSEMGRDGRKHRPKHHMENDQADDLSSSASADESSKKYVYNIHVYCIGDVNDDGQKQQRARKERRDSPVYQHTEDGT